MKRKVSVRLPVNFDHIDICDFFNVDYELSPLKIYELSNTWITPEGICLINSVPVLESIQHYRDKINIYTLTAKLSILEDKTLILNDSQQYLLIHNPLFSYFHWFTESIPRLLLVKERIKDLVLLLPWKLKDIDFVVKSLVPFGVKKIEYIPPNTRVKVRHLVLPQLKPFSSVFYPEIIKKTRRIYVDYSLNIHGYDDLYPFIMFENSDTDAGISLINRYEIDEVINEYGIRKIDLLKYDLFDQVKITQNARLVVSPTSEILGTMCFMKKNTSVFELMRPSCYEMDPFNLRFLNMSSNLGINYYYQFLSRIASNHRTGEFRAGKSQLKRNLDKIFRNISHQKNLI